MNRTTAVISLAAALIGLVSTVLALTIQLGAFGDARIGFLPDLNPPPNPSPQPRPPVPPPPEADRCDPRPVPSLSVSVGAGPSGTELTISGQDYCADEPVVIRFHTERIADAQAGSDGTFSVGARIPGTFDAFAPQQYDIVATGQDSLRSTSVPFQLTAR